METFITEPGSVFWVEENVTIFDEPLSIVLKNGGNTSMAKTSVNNVLIMVVSTRASEIPESFVLCPEAIGWIQNTWLGCGKRVI